MNVRFDRGPLQKPRRTGAALVIEGHAARVHRRGDALRYPWGEEYRDAQELQRIVSLLPGTPVTLAHPPGLMRDGARGRVVGRVDAAWVDGEHAAVRMTITDAVAAREIEAGTKELSLGYACGVRADGHQTDTEVDHLAIVEKARCGSTCSLRTDARLDCSCTQIDRSGKSDERGATTGASMPTIEELQARIDELTGENKTLTGQLAERDALIAANATAAESEAVKAEKARADAAEAKVARFDETFQSAVRARAKLERLAIATLGPTVRLDDMTDRQIHETVVKRLDANADLTVSDAELRGQFNTLMALASKNAESQARVAEILGRANTPERKDDSESYEDLEKNRWKTTLKNGRTAAEGR